MRVDAIEVEVGEFYTHISDGPGYDGIGWYRWYEKSQPSSVKDTDEHFLQYLWSTYGYEFKDKSDTSDPGVSYYVDMDDSLFVILIAETSPLFNMSTLLNGKRRSAKWRERFNSYGSILLKKIGVTLPL